MAIWFEGTWIENATFCFQRYLTGNKCPNTYFNLLNSVRSATLPPALWHHLLPLSPFSPCFYQTNLLAIPWISKKFCLGPWYPSTLPGQFFLRYLQGRLSPSFRCLLKCHLFSEPLLDTLSQTAGPHPLLPITP